MGQLSRGVVVLHVSHQAHDPDRPWAKRRPATRRAQAAVVDGGPGVGALLLTSAQMIAGATLVEVEREGRPPRAVARVVHVDPEQSLALLAVDDPEVAGDLEPLPLAAATPTTGTLRTVRWTEQQLELATLRIQRITVDEVWYGRVRHPFLLGRSDIVGGGWAEPVVDGDGALVGLTTGQNEHTAWVVPVEVLAAYVARATDPAGYRPLPVLRFGWQWTTDRALARWLGLEAPRGVMIRGVPRGSTGDGVLRPRDVLVSLDGHAIDPRGYYRHPAWGWIEFTNLAVEGRSVGDVLRAVVVREGREVSLDLPLRPYDVRTDRIPVRRGDEPPPYAIVGGLVFLELDGDYLRTWGDDWRNRAPVRLVAPAQLLEGTQAPEARRVVLLSQVLPCAWSLGYERCRDLLVETIDGHPVDGIAAVVARFAAAAGPFVRVGFFPNADRASLVVGATDLDAVTAEVLHDYGIPAAVRLPPPPPPLE